MKRFIVSAGSDFEVEAFEVEDVQEVNELSKITERRVKERFKATLTNRLLGFIALALLFAAGIGAYDGSFDEVRSVWGAAALPLGLILRAYFDKLVPT